MRFSRFGTYSFQDTPRKRAALLRKQRVEREALPLFADQIATEQECVDDVMSARAAWWNNQQQQERAVRAADWRRARNRLAAYRRPIRGELLAYWQRCKWPADPTYLLCMLHMHDQGRLELNPVYLSAAELAAARGASAA
ncbi:hypothetical protein [Delftia lacustris]|uniref:hypothetical protein n=1 Tax=Delftia lacustris TaxID=558537 RepID=UPI00064075CD|nr:hypothetical protein [Delftia lacustris]